MKKEIFISELDEKGRVPLWKIPEATLTKEVVFGSKY